MLKTSIFFSFFDSDCKPLRLAVQPAAACESCRRMMSLKLEVSAASGPLLLSSYPLLRQVFLQMCSCACLYKDLLSVKLMIKYRVLGTRCRHVAWSAHHQAILGTKSQCWLTMTSRGQKVYISHPPLPQFQSGPLSSSCAYNNNTIIIHRSDLWVWWWNIDRIWSFCGWWQHLFFTTISTTT